MSASHQHTGGQQSEDRNRFCLALESSRHLQETIRRGNTSSTREQDAVNLADKVCQFVERVLVPKLDQRQIGE